MMFSRKSLSWAGKALAAVFVCITVGVRAATVSLAERGIAAGVMQDQSDAINRVIGAAADGDELVFACGEYYLTRPLLFKGKRNLTVRGEPGTVLKLHYSPYGRFSENYGAVEAFGCRGLRIEGFIVTTDNPTSCAGRIVATDAKGGTYDVLVDSAFPMTGQEHFASTDTCDEEGTPDWIIETYEYEKGDAHELIGPQLVRVKAPRQTDFSRLEKGHRVLYRHSVYNRQCFNFEGCRDVTVRDVEIERCASMAAVIDHCADFTFERFNVRVPKTSPALVGANADAVHVIGMRGRLNLVDCHFERLGDDALNVHAQAGKVKSYDPKSGGLTCVRRIDGKDFKLEETWAKPGDELIVYDVETFLERGRVKLLEYANGKGRIDAGGVDVQEGDLLANALDFPVVAVRGCTLRHTRARALVLQSREMTISDCSFYGTSLPGVLIAPDAHRWAEVGPVAKVTIENCRFEKCGCIRHKANLGALVVKASHDGGLGDFPAGVHRNITIRGNRFVDCPTRGVCVTATENLVVVGNSFKNSGPGMTDILVHNCRRVDVRDNVTDKGAELRIVAPADGAVVPLLTWSQKAYYDLPRSERVAAVMNAAARARLSDIGTDPNPVHLSWRIRSDSGFRPRFSVKVFRRRDRCLAAFVQTVENSVDVPNLEIATEYDWTVSALEGDVPVASADGHFVTEDRAPRFLKVPGVKSFRDLGGRRGLGGRRVRQNLIFRSKGLNSNATLPDKEHPDRRREPGKCWLTSETKDLIVNQFGIRTDLDLRRDDETWGMTGSPVGDRVRWVHVPAHAYDGMPTKAGKTAFAQHFRLFLDKANYPIDFHCIAGADRTGSLAYILGGLLGVDEDELWKDWETNVFIDSNPEFRHRNRMEFLSTYFNSLPGETLAEKVEYYVVSCGFTKDDVRRFREIMLEGVDD